MSGKSKTLIAGVAAILWLTFTLPAGAAEAATDQAPDDQLQSTADLFNKPEENQAGTPSISLTGEGNKISLEAVQVKLVDLVRLLADQTGANVVIDPDVEGTVTVSFKDVTLQQALESVLDSNGYAMNEDKGVMRVMKAENLPVKLESREFRLQSVSVVSLQDQLKQLVSPLGKVVIHEQSNSLVIIDTQEVLDRVAKFLQAVDVREPQVTIKAQLIEVSADRRDQLGFSWDWVAISAKSVGDLQGTLTQALLPAEATEFQAGVSNSHFSSALRALRTDTNVNLLSAPTITTINNQEATVEITEDLPYIESTTSIESAAAGGSTTSTESVEFISVGVKLTVLPQIGNDGRVKLTVTPEVSEAPTRFEGIPVVKSRRARTTVVVKNGQTFVLGGLMRENVTDVVKRVPILSRIPLLGALFKSKDKKAEKVELLIFITPTIVDEEIAGKHALSEQDRLLGMQPGP